MSRARRSSNRMPRGPALLFQYCNADGVQTRRPPHRRYSSDSSLISFSFPAFWNDEHSLKTRLFAFGQSLQRLARRLAEMKQTFILTLFFLISPGRPRYQKEADIHQESRAPNYRHSQTIIRYVSFSPSLSHTLPNDEYALKPITCLWPELAQACSETC